MRHNSITLLVILLFACQQVLAYPDSLDKMVEDLVYEQIDNKKLVVKIFYESSEQVSQVKNKHGEISDVSLINHDPKRASFRVKVNYTNGVVDELPGRYETFVAMPITSRFIRAGEIILAADITTVNTKTPSRILLNYISNESEIIGMQAKKHLPAGTLLQANNLVRPAVIKLNDPVNITYTSGNIKLKASGVALGIGAIGDMIKVKNVDTGTVLLGQITNKNTVQVSGE